MTISHTDRDHHDTAYRTLERLIAERIADIKGPVFTTDADPADLWDAYLEHIPAECRQHYNCRCCQRFVQTYYGSLVTVDPDGYKASLLWNLGPFEEPEFFADPVIRMSNIVNRSQITGVFLSPDPVWGTPSNTSKKTGTTWTHLHGYNPAVFTHPTKTASQIMAEKREDYATLRRGLTDYPLDAVKQAVRVLEADALDGSEKTVGIARWLLTLQEKLAATPNPRQQDNLCWLAVATAPPGWCHIRSTMISTLLDDIVTGMDFAAISRRWSAKMHPLAYQRPQVLKEGHIAAGNKIMEQLQSAKALDRRFARLEEIATIWRPQPQAATTIPSVTGRGVFDHLKPKPEPVKELILPPVKMTWTRFRDEVLPNAIMMELKTPWCGGYIAVLTAVDLDAPQLWQWPNPFSIYVYPNGSLAEQWSLLRDTWTPVTAITTHPAHWFDNPHATHHNEVTIFILQGCKDTITNSGNGIFPAFMRSEYREIRHAVEAYSRSAQLSGREEASACGLALQKGAEVDYHIRVKTVSGTNTYRLDRWN